MFLGIRNPATFIPALVKAADDTRLNEAVARTDPRVYRWSELIKEIREALPALDLVIWCNEDTPFVWEQLIREIAALDPGTPIHGRHDLLAEIMTPDGLKGLESYLDTHQVMTDVQKRRVIAAFLDKFVRPEALEIELDIPGWSDTLVDALTDIYEEDIFAIQRIPGVTMITP